MTIFKAALISIKRKRLNSIILILVVFILANVIFTTYAVTSSINAAKETVLDDQAPTAQILLDYGDGEFEKPKSRDYPLRTEDVQTLYNKTKDMVKSYDYNISGLTSVSSDLEVFEVEDSDIYVNDGDFKLIEIFGTQLTTTSLVANGQAKLISGNGFSESDITNGNNVAIITNHFSKSSGLKVGDTLQTIDRIKDIPINGTQQQVLEEIRNEYKIVGILQVNSIDEELAKYNQNKGKDKDIHPNKEQGGEMYETVSKANTIHVPNKTVQKIKKEALESSIRLIPNFEENSGYDLQKIEDSYITPTFLLKDINDLDKFTKIAKEVYSEDSIIVYSAKANFDKIAKPLETMSGLLKTILMVTVISGIIIISLILCIFIYLRQKDIGIILALGQRKIKIVLQLLFESLTLTVIGAVLAIVSGYFISDIIANRAVDKMIARSDAQSILNSPVGADSSFNISAEAISKQFQNGITLQIIGVFLAIMILTVIIAQLITVLYLLRLKPKKILM